MRASRRKAVRSSSIEILEDRCLLSAAADLIGVNAMRVDPAFAGINGSGIGVAVIDTGIDRTHPDLASAYVAGYDFINSDNNPNDEQGHGTHVSGIVAARDPNIGIATGAGLIDLKVGGANGTTRIDLRATEAALQWVQHNAQQYNIRVVNMSLGGGVFTSSTQASDDILFDDVRRLEAMGITVVSAAGNEYENFQEPGSSSPGIFSTLDVGAVWEENEGGPIPSGASVRFKDFTTGPDRVTFFSFRPNTDNAVFAPGALILSTLPGGQFGLEGGTSQASPMVAGAVALMQQAAFQFGGRYLTPVEVRQIIRSSGDIINDGDDENTSVQTTGLNFPRLNAYRAVQSVWSLFNGGTLPTPNPTPTPGVDSNGTLAGALVGPTLDGSAVLSVPGSIGVDGASSIGGKDVDIVRLDLPIGGTLTLDLLATGQPFDSFLRLFDAAGNEIARNDDKSPTDPASALAVGLNAGTYYVGTSGFSNTSYNPSIAGSGTAGATGSYQLNMKLDSPDPNGLTGGAVSLNVTQEPRLVGGAIGYDNASFDQFGNLVEGTIVGSQDVDLFRMTMPDNGTLFVETNTPFTSNYADTFLRVFHIAADGTISSIASDDDGQLPGDSDGHPTDSFAAVSVQAGEEILVGVSDTANRPYDPSSLAGRSAAGTGGFYDLIISFQNNDVNGTIPTASAASLPMGQAMGSIGSDVSEANPVGDRDVDFFRFNTPNAGVLSVRVDSESRSDIGQTLDSVLTLFDAAGNVLLSNDDFNGLDPQLRFYAQPNTDYYVAVSGYGNSNFNPFVTASGTAGATGNYLISASLGSPGEVAGITDNSIQANAPTPIALGQVLDGDIGLDGDFLVGAADVDVYRFVAPATQIITLRTTHAPGNEFTGANTVMRLFDANGNQMAVNDNSLMGTTESLLRTGIIAGQTYYIGISGAGPNSIAYNPLTGAGAAAGSTGDYQLMITAFHGFVAAGADAGASPSVRVFDAVSGTRDLSFVAYDPAFTGGVRVAVADLSGDGLPDVVTAPGPGATPQIRVFDGFTAQPIAGPLGTFLAYDAGFRGGVNVASGDVNGDGREDIIVGVDGSAGPHVKVFDGRTGVVLYSFFAYDPGFLGGARVAAGDVNGDGRADIIAGSGGAAPHVKVFDGRNLDLLASYFAYDPGFQGGITVGAGDVNGDGRAEVITGTSTGPTHVKAFGFAGFNTPPLLASFFAYQGFFGGVRVDAEDVNGDGMDEILTGTGPGAAHAEAFTAAGTPVLSFFAFPNYAGGIYVAG